MEGEVLADAPEQGHGGVAVDVDEAREEDAVEDFLAFGRGVGRCRRRRTDPSDASAIDVDDPGGVHGEAFVARQGDVGPVADPGGHRPADEPNTVTRASRATSIMRAMPSATAGTRGR